MSGIYFHIPFCKQACHYCDFHFSTNLKKKEALLEAMALELRARKDELKGSIASVYFGGGTPSLLSAQEVASLIEQCRTDFYWTEKVEVTLEMNPDDVSQSRLEGLREAGVNRISLGIQSFIDRDLRFMNRAHSAKEAEKALEAVCAVFDNVSIDLIYGVPGQDEKDWEENLQKTFANPIQHLSSYALTVEEKTALAHFIRKGDCQAPSETLAKQHFDHLRSFALSQGMVHYEVSNFGRPGYFSKHNTSYWQSKDYLGIGPSAHSYDGTKRRWNVANNQKYIKGLARASEVGHEAADYFEEELLSSQDRINESLMIGLRTIWGINLVKLEVDFGRSVVDSLLNKAAPHLQEGKLLLKEGALKATEEGQFLIDGIASDLFFIDENV